MIAMQLMGELKAQRWSAHVTKKEEVALATMIDELMKGKSGRVTRKA
jgi:hypothetical protein